MATCVYTSGTSTLEVEYEKKCFTLWDSTRTYTQVCFYVLRDTIDEQLRNLGDRFTSTDLYNGCLGDFFFASGVYLTHVYIEETNTTAVYIYTEGKEGGVCTATRLSPDWVVCICKWLNDRAVGLVTAKKQEPPAETPLVHRRSARLRTKLNSE